MTGQMLDEAKTSGIDQQIKSILILKKHILKNKSLFLRLVEYLFKKTKESRRQTLPAYVFIANEVSALKF